MSMLKKLKGLFVVDDGKEASAKPAPKGGKEPSIEELEKSMKTNQASSTTKKATPEATGTTKKTNPGTKSSANEKPDGKFVNVLLKAIEANNQEGFDYLEYKQSLQNLGNVEMDQPTRYQSALALAKTMGATPSKLITSAKHYIKVLDNEGAKFKQASQNQTKLQVTGKQDEIKALEKAIIDKRKEIEKLTADIEKHKKTLEKTKSTIDNAAAKVQQTTDKFMMAYNVVKGQILSDIDNMEKYLK